MSADVTRLVAARIVLTQDDGTRWFMELEPADSSQGLDAMFEIENEARQLTQEETGSSPWAEYEPTGTRYASVSVKGVATRIERRKADMPARDAP